MIPAVALVAFAFIAPFSANETPAMRLLRDSLVPSEFALNPFAHQFNEPESLLEGVREGMRRLNPGMNFDQVERLLRVKALSFSMTYGSSLGSTYIYGVGTKHSLRLRFDTDEPGLRYAILYRDGEVVEQVGR